MDVGCSRSGNDVDDDADTGMTEKAWLKKRRTNITEAMDGADTSMEEVQGASRALSSHLLSETILAEQSFLKSKQHKNRMIAYLDKALLDSEVDGEFREVAQAFKDLQDKEDEEKRRQKKRRADLLCPKNLPDPMSKLVWVSPEVLDDAALALLRGCLVGDQEHADFIVEEDPANPCGPSLWSAFLMGKVICNLDYVTSRGKTGNAFSYSPAITIKRQVFLSASFQAEFPELAQIVKLAIASHISKWQEIVALEQFVHESAHATTKKNHVSFYSIVQIYYCYMRQKQRQKTTVTRRFVGQSTCKEKLCGGGPLLRSRS